MNNTSLATYEYKFCIMARQISSSMCVHQLDQLFRRPFCFIYFAMAPCRSNPSNVNEAILTWGDTGGTVNALHFNSANIALFERPPAPSGEKQGNK